MPTGIYKHHAQQGFQKGHPDFTTSEKRKQMREKLLNCWKIPKWRERMIQKMKGRKATKGMTGKKHSVETLKKMSGVNSCLWKGGIAKTSQKRWKEKNKDRVIFLNGRRRARKLESDGSHTLNEWKLLKKKFKWTCPCCNKKEPEIRLSEDHIIPLSKGGSDYIENIQPLCRSCNSKKRVNIISYNSSLK